MDIKKIPLPFLNLPFLQLFAKSNHLSASRHIKVHIFERKVINNDIVSTDGEKQQ